MAKRAAQLTKRTTTVVALLALCLIIGTIRLSKRTEPVRSGVFADSDLNATAKPGYRLVGRPDRLNVQDRNEEPPSPLSANNSAMANEHLSSVPLAEDFYEPDSDAPRMPGSQHDRGSSGEVFLGQMTKEVASWLHRQGFYEELSNRELEMMLMTAPGITKGLYGCASQSFNYDEIQRVDTLYRAIKNWGSQRNRVDIFSGKVIPADKDEETVEQAWASVMLAFRALPDRLRAQIDAGTTEMFSGP